MSHPVTIGKTGWFSTIRSDAWWLEPLLVVVGLGLFVIYTTISAVFLDSHFEYGPYLSPFYEPLLTFHWWHFSPAILILWVPLAFRTTCYYYRGAYYKAFFLNPPACAVTGSQTKAYRGESRFPFILMKLHRFTLYLALVLNAFLWWGAIRSFWYEGDRRGIGRAHDQRVSSDDVLARVSLAPPSRRGQARLLFVLARVEGETRTVGEDHLLERKPQEMGVDESDLCGTDRSLYPAGVVGRDPRFQHMARTLNAKQIL